MTTQIVSNIADLQIAINNAVNGSIIIIKNGTYIANNLITIRGSGITVKAETVGSVIFNTGNISFNIIGNKNVLQGIQFLNCSNYLNNSGGANYNQYDLISVSGSSNSITNININNVYAQHYINIYGGFQYNTIGYCNIQNKPMDNMNCMNSMIEIQGDPIVVGFHNINHCTFQGMTKGSGGDYGCEPIRLGDSQYSTCNLSTIIEYCVFDNTHLADSETISVKSMNNIIRYNTFSNNIGGYVSFRNGNNNIAYGNFFLNSSGIRVKQASNISVYNNYFYNCNSPFLFVDLTGLYSNLSLYQNNINIQNNTFYNCGSLVFGTRDTTRNTIANNIFFETSTKPQIISGDTNGFTCIGNLYYGTLGITNSTGFSYTLLLVFNKNTYGYYTISGNYPSTTVGVPYLLFIPNLMYDMTINYDIGGLTRFGTKDVGCNQYSNRNQTPLNYPLSVQITGPSYLQNP